MPIDENGIGYSEYTPLKQDFFRGFIRLNLRIWKGVLRDYKNSYFQGDYTYWDITAGPGWHESYGYGSPLIFLEEIEKLEMHYQAHFWDKNSETIQSLNSNISKYLGNDTENRHLTYRSIDHKDGLRFCASQDKNRVPGLLYCDLNAEIPPFELLARFAAIWTKVDILINYAGTTPKRRPDNCRIRTSEYINMILRSRKSCMIRKPLDKHQWTFLFFTNGPITDWKKEHFINVNSQLGQEYLRRIDYGKSEYPRQPALPNL